MLLDGNAISFWMQVGHSHYTVHNHKPPMMMIVPAGCTLHSKNGSSAMRDISTTWELGRDRNYGGLIPAMLWWSYLCCCCCCWKQWLTFILPKLADHRLCNIMNPIQKGSFRWREDLLRATVLSREGMGLSITHLLKMGTHAERKRSLRAVWKE